MWPNRLTRNPFDKLPQLGLRERTALGITPGANPNLFCLPSAVRQSFTSAVDRDRSGHLST